MTTSRLFISYGRSDDPAFVRRLRDDLLARARAEGRGPLRVFIDELDMPSRGRSFLLEIRDFIGDPETERLLLVIGPAALASAHVRSEWRIALDRCVAVLPLLRIGRAEHSDPRDVRRVDAEDFATIPEEVREMNAHAIDFREQRGDSPGRPYAEAFDDLWRALSDPITLAPLAPEVPDMPGSFVPRMQDLKVLSDVLLTDADQPVALTGERRFAAICGMGGIGKSVLAAAFCRACKTRHSFKDGIAWVRMGPHPILPAELIDLIPSAHATAGRRAGRGLRDLACLIVLDDVVDPAHVARFTSGLGESGRLLLTTRNAAVATALGAKRCDLDLLTEAQSLQLMTDWVGCTAADLPPAAREAVEECGRLPLAIAMIGAMMKGRPVERWQHVLADLRGANLDEIRHRFAHYEHPDLLRALKVSVDALDGFAPDDAAHWERKWQARRRYLDLAVFAGNTPLPRPMLQRYWSAAGATEAVADKLCDLFVDRSLARRDERGRVVLHDLLHDYLVAEQRDALPALHRRLLDAHRPAGGWCDLEDDGYLPAHLAQHLQQADRVQELGTLVSRSWMERRLATTGSHLGFSGDVRLFIESLGKEPLAESLVALVRACLALGSVTALTAQVTQSFVGAMARCGEVDQAIRHITLMRDPKARILALTAVGGLLAGQGSVATAERLIAQVQSELQALAGQDREFEAQCLSWQAGCLAQLGRMEPALAAAAQVQRIFSKDEAGLVFVEAMERTARAYLRAGQVDEARRIARRIDPWSAPALLVEVDDPPRLAAALASVRSGRASMDDSTLLVAESLFLAGRQAEAHELVGHVQGAIAKIVSAHERALMQSSAAVTLAKLGRPEQAAALAASALAPSPSRDQRWPPDLRFHLLRNLSMMACAQGHSARAAQFRRQALKIAMAQPPSQRLDYLSVVAELLAEAGRPAEARQLLQRGLADTWALHDHWAHRDTAGVLATALVRVDRQDEAVLQLAGLSDRFGARGRAQVCVAVALADAGALHLAHRVASEAREVYQSEACSELAAKLAHGGLQPAARSLAMGIGWAQRRALTLCRIAPTDDHAALAEAIRHARGARDAQALGRLAERLSGKGRTAMALEFAREALTIASRLEDHAQVSSLGELGRAFLALHDEAGLAAVDVLLKAVTDREYRAEGRLRLALAFAQAGRHQQARTIVDEEWPVVRGLRGSDVARASMMADAAFVLLHAGATRNAVRRARTSLRALTETGAAWSSAYDKDLAWQRAVEVLARTDHLEQSFAAQEVGFADLADACAAGCGGGEARLRRLIVEARQQTHDGLRAHALACVAQALARLGLRDEARPLIFEAVFEARYAGRAALFDTLQHVADLIAELDRGETLIRISAALREIDDWWPLKATEL